MNFHVGGRSADGTGRTIADREHILGGACIVRTVVSKLSREALTVSDRGLRHGVAAERCG